MVVVGWWNAWCQSLLVRCGSASSHERRVEDQTKPVTRESRGIMRQQEVSTCMRKCKKVL
jgi:hypothetical protein